MSDYRLPVSLGDRSYEIEIAAGLIASGRGAKAIADLFRGHRVCLVTHPKLAPLYAVPLENGLKAQGIETALVQIPPGEHRKNLATVAKLYDAFLAARLDRKCGIVAVGGGVLGDMAGFAAATFLRGIDFVQVPTTLLAQVDSSVGGKTGVDVPQGKNLVGAFHQPRCVLIDPDTLHTLPPRELRSGLAEVVKYGIIYDSDFFDRLTKAVPRLLRRDPNALADAIARSCEIKAEVVSQDETEQGLRAILNFGHTIGHALEAVTKYRVYTHGEAIAIGMVIESRLGERIAVTPPGTTDIIARTFQSAGLPTVWPAEIDTDAILQAAQTDKKTVAGRLKFLIPQRIGAVVASDAIPETIVREVLR